MPQLHDTSTTGGRDAKRAPPTTTAAPALPPPEQEHLPCPRCDSTNTKFCYYNNYNFSQPRHFCKSCRRYWTHGGTLRDIPVGGGTRRSAKRCRTSSFPSSAASAAEPTVHLAGTPLLVGKNGVSPAPYGGGGDQVGKAGNFFWALGGGPLGLGLDGKGSGGGLGTLCGSFTSLLSNPGAGISGNGFGSGFEDLGFGLGRGVWPFQGAEDGGGAGFGGGGGGSCSNMWQFESGESGFGGGGGGNDCLSWPDLAISTLGNGLK